MTFAIVIPVFRHSVLVSDAIGSALALPDTEIVVVNDGCPHAETRSVLEGWAQRAPDRIRVVTQPNLGLSAARNTGISIALKRQPQAIFFLDADNRLDPHSATLWARELADHPDADWFYPHFDFFGLSGNAHSGPGFSLALMSESNFCEAGSLVRTRVFEAGLRFDTCFRQGYEDWDFWLSAAREDFRGRPFREAFFRYRKRPESMLAGSHATDAALRAQLQAKHRWLYDRDKVAQLLPAHFLMIESGTLTTTEFSDPRAPTPIELDVAITRFLDAQARPAEVFQPLTWAIARPGIAETLDRHKLLTSTLWHLRQWTEDADMATLRIRRSADGLIRMEATPPGIRAQDLPRPPNHRTRREQHLEDEAEKTLRAAERDAIATADILLFSTAFLERHAFRRAKRADGSTPTSTPFSRASVAAITCSLPEIGERTGEPPHKVFEELDAKMQAMRDRYPPEASQARWRSDPQTVRPKDMEGVLRRRALGGLPLPLKQTDDLRIGFVVPIFKFGGVEKCVVALARELAELEIRCHLFVYGAEGMTPIDWLTEPFETVLPLSHPSLRNWSGPDYLGTNLAPDLPTELLRDIAAPLTGMDVVVTTGSAAMGQILGFLRGRGVVTCSWEHLLETGRYGRSYGTPYIALAHEAALDLVLSCSDKLRHWLHGQGVPIEKLLTLPNGPGFPDPQPRAGRSESDRLRVGFLGRLDHQKGVDRFLRIVARCNGDPIDFSVTGAAIVEGEVTLPDTITRHPPAYTLEELHDAFARLDVLLMPSRDEGLPLAIFEAQRACVIPVVTDVGAVSEAIRHEDDGLLLNSSNVVEDAVGHLRRLAGDPDLRRRCRTPRKAGDDRWAANAHALLARLQPLIEERNASSRSTASLNASSEAAKEMRK